MTAIDTTTRSWFGTPSLEAANRQSAESLIGYLGIEFTEVGEDYLVARMPVDDRTRQPFGVLHGGASVALAETLASWAATFEINANHLRPVTSGSVTGTAHAILVGKRTQVWEVAIRDDDAKLVCVSRCTLAVIPARPHGDRGAVSGISG